MADRPFDNPWPSPPIAPGGAPPAAVPYYDPAYIERVLAPSTQPDDQGYTPGAVPPDTGAQQGNVADYAPGAVGDAEWGGGGYVGEDFYSPDRGKLSRAALNRLLGEKSSGGWPGYGVILGLGGNFLSQLGRAVGSRLTHRRLMPSPLQRANRIVTRNIERMIGRTVAPILQRALPWLAVAAPELGGAFGVLYPTRIGTETILPAERIGGGPPMITHTGPGGVGFVGPTIEMVEPSMNVTPGIEEPTNAPPGALAPTLPGPPGSHSWRQRFEQRLRQRVDASKQELEQRFRPQALNQGPPTPATPYDSGIAGYTPKQVTLPGPQAPARTPGIIRWGQLVGAIGAGTAIEALRSSRSSLINSSSTSSPSFSPISSLQPTPVTSIGSMGFGVTSTGCSCESARGPRRRCLERAPVSWRSGRNKGKAAGTKCVRFASRRTAA